MSTNILNIASSKQLYWSNLMKDLGYTTISTFYQDLTIAEFYGISSIKDTYKNVIKNWGNDTKMFTEFCMCLNHKIWEWCDNKELAEVYDELWRMAEDFVFDNWNEEQKEYYLRITD